MFPRIASHLWKGDTMGFFRSANFIVHARSIAEKFKQIREDQFSSAVYNAEHALKKAVPRERRVLGGEADIAMKGYQFWITLGILNANTYVAKQHAKEFIGHLIVAGWRDEHEAVDHFCLELQQHRDNPAEQMVNVAFPIADYICDCHDPFVATDIARFLPVFAIRTELAVSSEFGDKRAVELLEEQLNEIRKCWKSQNNSAFRSINVNRTSAEIGGMPERSARLPDLGKRLAMSGAAQRTKVIYPSLTIDEISVVGLGSYCTTVIQEMDGKQYCATLDFGDEMLARIMESSTERTRDVVIGSLTEDPEHVRRILIPDPISIGVEAILGAPQQSLEETFIPLILTNVF